MFHKPCLCVRCPETHHCLSHYASNSHANLWNLFISLCPEGYFVTLTPIYNIVPLRNCPLNSQSQSRGMEIHFYLHLVVHGKNMKLSKRSDLFILKYTFRKWPFLNDHCLLVVNNCSLHYSERFSESEVSRLLTVTKMKHRLGYKIWHWTWNCLTSYLYFQFLSLLP